MIENNIKKIIEIHLNPIQHMASDLADPNKIYEKLDDVSYT